MLASGAGAGGGGAGRGGEHGGGLVGDDATAASQGGEGLAQGGVAGVGLLGLGELVVAQGGGALVVNGLLAALLLEQGEFVLLHLLGLVPHAQGDVGGELAEHGVLAREAALVEFGEQVQIGGDAGAPGVGDQHVEGAVGGGAIVFVLLVFLETLDKGKALFMSLSKGQT